MAKRLLSTRELYSKEYEKLSATKGLPLHQHTLSIQEAIAIRKVSKCELPPHLAWIFKRLTERLQYAKRRCEAPTCAGYKTYGARGIQFRFKSVRDSVLWVLENLPHPTYHGVEIDRINNNGHYQPGNLKLSTRRQNANNRYTTFWVPLANGSKLAMQDFMRAYPVCGYGRDQIKHLVEKGLTGEQIIHRYQTSYHQPTWRKPRRLGFKRRPGLKRKKRKFTTS